LRTHSRRLPKLALAVVIAAVCSIVWVAKATRAQTPAQDGPPVAPLEKAGKSVQEPSVPKGGITEPDLPTEASAPRLADQPPAAPAALRDRNPTLAPTTAPPAADEPPRAPLPSSVPALDRDDPDKAALAFVEQNQKHAESQLKSLKDEEARLRSRLQKIETGIRRWQTLLDALKQSQGNITIVVPDAPRSRVEFASDSEPAQLEPAASIPKRAWNPQPSVQTPAPPTDDNRLGLPTPK
jgi:hypothetical protein